LLCKHQKAVYLHTMKVTLKKLILFILFALIAVSIFNYKLIGYGLGQAKGQIKVMWNARSIADVLADPQFPDSLKTALSMVAEIKQFAVDTLGLKPSENYTTVYNQQGKEILWVVTGCEPYKFEPLMWSFPLIGSFTYKGFFDHQKAIVLAKKLKSEGLDVELRSVSGWSTLGWFKDPILSNMLADGPGELANTIIHELTHGTIFIPDSMTFNENLATFIGTKGASNFLQAKYGVGSKEYVDFLSRRADSKLFTQYIVQAAKQLDSLYRQIDGESDTTKEFYKAAFIDEIVANMDTIVFTDEQRYKQYFAKYRPNNAYFISFLNYRERQDEFELMLADSLDNQLAPFIAYWRLHYEK
jgi:predicted aminopeptidase